MDDRRDGFQLGLSEGFGKAADRIDRLAVAARKIGDSIGVVGCSARLSFSYTLRCSWKKSGVRKTLLLCLRHVVSTVVVIIVSDGLG